MARREAAEGWDAEGWAERVVISAGAGTVDASEVEERLRRLTEEARCRARKAREQRRECRERSEVVAAAGRRAWRVVLAPVRAAMRGWEAGGRWEAQVREAEGCVKALGAACGRRWVVASLVARQGALVEAAAGVWLSVAETLRGLFMARKARLARGCGDLDPPADCVVSPGLGEVEVAEDCEAMVEELGRMVRGEETEGVAAVAERLVRAREARERGAHRRLLQMGQPEELRRLQALAKADVLRGLWVNPEGSPDMVENAIAFIKENAALPRPLAPCAVGGGEA